MVVGPTANFQKEPLGPFDLQISYKLHTNFEFKFRDKHIVKKIFKAMPCNFIISIKNMATSFLVFLPHKE